MSSIAELLSTIELDPEDLGNAAVYAGRTTFTTVILRRMEEREISYAQLSKLTGIPEFALPAMVTGDVYPGIEDIIRILFWLGIDFSSLLHNAS